MSLSAFRQIWLWLSLGLLPGCMLFDHHAEDRGATGNYSRWQQHPESPRAETAPPAKGPPTQLPSPGELQDPPSRSLPTERIVQRADVIPPRTATREALPVVQGPDIVPEPRLKAQVPAGMNTSLAEAAAPVEAVQQVKNKPNPDPALVAALRCFLEKRPAEAIQWLNVYDATTQDFLLRMLPLVAGCTEVPSSLRDPHTMSAMVAQLDRISDELRPRADLQIQRICFCSSVKRYGDYRPLPKDHVFHPGEIVSVYVELKNFSCLEESGAFSVRLANHIYIAPAGGGQGWHGSARAGDLPEWSKSRPHDCSKTYSIPLPSDLQPGEHKLVLVIEDLPTGRKVERSLPITIAARKNQ